MNNPTAHRSGRAIKICALPLAFLVATSASAASITWTLTTDEVWKSDTSGSFYLSEAKAEFSNNSTPENIMPPVLKIVSSAGIINISGTGNLTLNSGDANPDKRVEEFTVNAILACLGNQVSPIHTSQQLAANGVIGTSEVNLTKIPANTFNQNPFGTRVDTEAQANSGHSLTGRLSGTSGTELTSTVFVGGASRSSQNASIPAFPNSNLASGNGGGFSTATLRTSRKSSVASFTEKLQANTSNAQFSHDNLSATYDEHSFLTTDQFNAVPTSYADSGAAKNSNPPGVASYLLQNDLSKIGQDRNWNNTDLTNIALPKQGVVNSSSIIVSAGPSLNTGFEEIIPTTEFASAALSSNTPTATRQPADFAPAYVNFAGTVFSNNTQFTPATPAPGNSIIAKNTSSTGQFNFNQKTPTLRRAVFTASPPATETDIAFDSAGLLLKNNAGVALSAGGPGDGDGIAVQIGYYDGATTSNNFSGNWVPLTGQNSLNTAFLTTSIGDGQGVDGEFYGTYVFNSSLPNTFNSLPPSTTIPLSLRFYNTLLISNATLFNTVSDDLWLWKTPASPSPFPPQIIMSLGDAGLEWQGGNGTEFKTTLAIPEPTSALLLAAGAAGLLGRRRRRA